MLKKLSVENYALIESLEMHFNPGFSVITGETGAGKSILLGALSLILGSRADTSALKNSEQKCIIEGQYDIRAFGLNNFFEREGLDYFNTAILRREISPQGRSRAFINDTPVNLNLLKELGDRLTDIHSQHHNLALADRQFQLYALDAFAGLIDETNAYENLYDTYKQQQKALEKLRQSAENEKAEQDYLQFRYDELEKARLQVDEQEELEEKNRQMTHAADIKQACGRVSAWLAGDEFSVADNLKQSIQALTEIENFLPEIQDYKQRLETCRIELADIASDMEIRAEDTVFSPEEAEAASRRLDVIYDLQKKHQVETVEELLLAKDELAEKLENIASYDQQIKKAETALQKKSEELEKLAEKIGKQRRSAHGALENKITALLKKLGMPNASFKIVINRKQSLSKTGKDDVAFLFSANKNTATDEISKIASGGEMSRLMLSLKSVIAGSVNLPTIIFDEIDTGISGDIADKTAGIMQELSKNLQVIDITHLPQIAAKADTHYVIYKTEESGRTRTKVKQLNDEDRTNEIAKMLSGENISDAAVKNARELIHGK